jgi:hypothetical protein
MERKTNRTKQEKEGTWFNWKRLSRSRSHYSRTYLPLGVLLLKTTRRSSRTTNHIYLATSSSLFKSNSRFSFRQLERAYCCLWQLCKASIPKAGKLAELIGFHLRRIGIGRTRRTRRRLTFSLRRLQQYVKNSGEVEKKIQLTQDASVSGPLPSPLASKQKQEGTVIPRTEKSSVQSGDSNLDPNFAARQAEANEGEEARKVIGKKTSRLVSLQLHHTLPLLASLAIRRVLMPRRHYLCVFATL